MYNKCIINLAVLFVTGCGYVVQTRNLSVYDICPLFKKGDNLNIQDVVGSWMTVYTQPKALDCFKFNIRATMELEREQYIMKYGDFGGRVEWNLCLLQVDTPQGKHFLMGNGTASGLMKNVIILEKETGKYTLLHQSADQWTVFGRRGSEVLLIRDCYGDSAAAFARTPYWPSATELSAIFHRSGVMVQTYGQLLCEPQSNSKRRQKYGVQNKYKRL